MKNTRAFSLKLQASRGAIRGCLAVLLATLLGFSCDSVLGQAQPGDHDAPGTEVLTRGPVHEAFAGIVTFNPEPGVIVVKSPPAVIEEMPPEERPVGDNVTWIPGYWAWDDERSDFLWVSGTWRALPPGRAWIAGYWAKATQGFQWTSGYWADATVRETTYLPPPPATVEAGPNVAAPSMDYGWSPGCWIWTQERYAWRPGYWALGRADWDWTPAHYVWSPRGCIFVDGFWDFPVERRGLLFAPVYFEAGVYARRGYVYSPRIVIGFGVFSDCLFLRPRYHHYYFGDYYAPGYFQGGFYASFTFQSGRHGYDPISSHHRWEHRQERDWDRRVVANYENRRDHEAARPPRSWAAERTLHSSPAGARPNRVELAMPIGQLATRKDGPMRLQTVAKAERQQLSRRGQEVETSREQRRTLEAQPASPAGRLPGGGVKPARVPQPKTPIASAPARELRKSQSPPEPQRVPRSSPNIQPSRAPGSPPPDGNGIRSNPPRGKDRTAERIQAPAARVRSAPVEKGAPRLIRREGRSRAASPPN